MRREGRKRGKKDRKAEGDEVEGMQERKTEIEIERTWEQFLGCQEIDRNTSQLEDGL